MRSAAMWAPEHRGHLRRGRRVAGIGGRWRLLPLALALVLLVPGRADARVTCDSGKTVYAHGRTRIFTRYRGTEFYLCSAVLRRPRQFASGNDVSSDRYYGWKPYGRRLSFLYEWVDGDDTGWTAGWIDLHTGALGEVQIQPGTEPAIDLPPDDLGENGRAVVVAPDGSIAILEHEGAPSTAQAIGYAQFGKRRFHRAHLLTTVDAGDVVAKSLAISGGSVTWKTRAGAFGSVPIR